MARNRDILIWELRKIGRFPLPEIIVLLLGLQIGLRMFDFNNSVSSGAFPTKETLDLLIRGQYQFHMSNVYSVTLSETFITLALASSLLVTISMALELENGTLRTYLSKPVGRGTLYISKFISVFLVTCILPMITLVVSMYVLDPSMYAIFLKMWKTWALLLIIMLITTFFVTAVGFFMATLTRSVALTPLLTLGMLFSTDLLSSRIVYLPGGSMSRIVKYVLSNIELTQGQAIISFIFMPLIGVILILIAYLFFTRRIDLN